MKRLLSTNSIFALATWLLIVVGAGRYIAENHEHLSGAVVEESVSETVERFQELECNAGKCGHDTSAPALNIPLNLSR